jgi:hypothetical protein
VADNNLTPFLFDEQLFEKIPVKRCRRCNLVKPRNEFKPTTKSHWIPSWCRQCEAEAARERYHAAKSDNPERLSSKQIRYGLAVNYGLRVEDYERLLAAQNGRCAICGTDKPGSNNRLFCVDHNHATDEIRGLLCNGCNRGLGYFNDSPVNLERALEYLKKPSTGLIARSRRGAKGGKPKYSRQRREDAEGKRRG